MPVWYGAADECTALHDAANECVMEALRGWHDARHPWLSFIGVISPNLRSYTAVAR